MDALTAHYGSLGRLTDYRRQFERTTRTVGEDPAIFATALETLAVKAFGDMGQTARLRLIRDRFIAGHTNCDLRRHLDSVSLETPIRDVVDRCRVWESHSDPAVSRISKPNPDPTYPAYAVGDADSDNEATRHKGTMWMSNDRVPLENVESPYGGGVSSLPGAAGDLRPVMFPVALVLLAGGHQLGSWQVAVMRVDETPAGDSSGREYPCAKQNRHRPIDISELPDGLGHTIVEGGPVGPEVIEPLELLVLDHADPAGQHAVIRDTTRLLEHPLTRPDSSLGDGLVEKISDWGPAARPVPDTTLDGRLRERILTWSIRLRGCPWTVDSWKGCRVWNHWSSRYFIHHWSSRYFIHHWLHDLVYVSWRKDQSGSR